jgi:hypothetical protein
MPTIFRDLYGEWCEIDNNIYLGKFLTETHVEPVASPSRERQVLSAFQPVKSHFSQWMPPMYGKPATVQFCQQVSR